MESRLQSALKTCTDDLGPRHNSRVRVLHKLAKFYIHHKRFAEAEPLLQELLVCVRGTVGNNHEVTIDVMHELLKVLKAQAKQGQADALQSIIHNTSHQWSSEEDKGEESAGGKRRRARERHPGTHCLLKQRGDWLSARQRHTEAEALYKEAVAVRTVCLGRGHEDTISAMNRLAACYRSQREYIAAERTYLEMLSALQERDGYTVEVMQRLVKLYIMMEAKPKALEVAERGYRVCKEPLGKEHPFTKWFCRHARACRV